LTVVAITTGSAPDNSAQVARGLLGWPCAGVSSAAWASAKRTGCTPFFEKVMGGSSHSYCSFCPTRTLEKVESPVRAVRFQPSYTSHGVVAHGRGCVGVQAVGCPAAAPLAPFGGGMAGVILRAPACHPGPVLVSHQLHPAVPATGGVTYFPTLPAATGSSPQHHTRSKDNV